MTSPRLLVGIDLGSTTTRAVAFDLAGRQVAEARRETPVEFPRPAWAEADPDRWWAAVAEVLRDLTARVPPDQIAAVGLSGLMHAPIVLDARNRPLAPAMLWMDQRCASQCAAMNAEAPDLERPLATTVSAPKLRWLADTHPDLLARAAQVVLPKDYLRIRLTGVGGTDPSDASGTGLFDRERAQAALAAAGQPPGVDIVDILDTFPGVTLPPAARGWIDRVVALAHLPPTLLPTVRPSWARAGGVTADAAQETGLPAGTPVAVGGSDVFCTRIAVGPLDDGEVCLYMGTAAWMSFTGRGSDGQPTIRGFGSTATTGAALRWARDLIAPLDGPDLDASYRAVLAGADTIPAGAEGLLFLPHLSGERGPTPEPLARGALVGLTLRHGRAHVARAVLEGTAFQIKRNFDERALAPVRGGVVAGGAARSDLWMRILVDVVGVPLRIAAETEASVLGAAILGGVAAGVFGLEDGQARMVQPGRELRPEPEGATRYAELYRRYCQLDAILLGWFREDTP